MLLHDSWLQNLLSPQWCAADTVNGRNTTTTTATYADPTGTTSYPIHIDILTAVHMLVLAQLRTYFLAKPVASCSVPFPKVYLHLQTPPVRPTTRASGSHALALASLSHYVSCPWLWLAGATGTSGDGV